MFSLFTSFIIFFSSEINALNLSILRNLFLFYLKSFWYIFLYFYILWNIYNLTKFEYIITIKIFKRSMLLLWFRNWFSFIIHWYKTLITIFLNEFFVCILVIKHVVNEFISELMHIIQSELFNNRFSLFEILTSIICISIDTNFFFDDSLTWSVNEFSIHTFRFISSISLH